MAKFSIKHESVLKSMVWSNFNNFHREGKKIHYAYLWTQWTGHVFSQLKDNSMSVIKMLKKLKAWSMHLKKKTWNKLT